MHFTTCLNPQHICVHGEERVVPCGKCDYCRSVRSMSISSRFDLEIASHKFGVFFTLTYADPFLPFMQYDSEHDLFYRTDSEEAFSFDDFDSGIFWNFKFMSEDSLKIVNIMRSKYGAVPCLRKGDVQRFMKRLRITINRKLNEKSVPLYYGICGEYGPTTFRPHYHGILLFDDQRLLQELPKILRTSWPFGSVVSRFLQHDEKSCYITRYINRLDGVPSIYRPKEVAPFLLISKSHPVGLYKIDKEEMQKIVHTCSPTISVQKSPAEPKFDVPLWPVLENWFFPKFSGFGCISPELRVRLLRLATTYDSLRAFIGDCQKNVDESYRPLCGSFDGVRRWSFSSDISEYFFLLNRDVSLPYNVHRANSHNALRTLYYCAKRIVRNMHKYCINSISDYLDIIDRYEFNKAQWRLKNQFVFEDEVMRREPSSIKYIDSLALDDGVYLTYDFIGSFAYHRNNIAHTKMNKRKQEYLRLHPEYSLVTQTSFNHL